MKKPTPQGGLARLGIQNRVTHYMTENRCGKGLPDGGSPLDWLRQGVFPEDWTLVPVQGKQPKVKGWPDKKRSRVDSEGLYMADSRSSGFGVVTGALSGGLIAVDIDGHAADKRYRQAVGEAYEPYGGETTMAWTSGKPGRRQILYRVPEYMVGLLAHVNTVILQLSGEWELGSGDVDREKEGAEEKYEEVVLRFNRCQSVLPQSRHPETKERYRFLQYHEGMPAEAPAWMLEVLRGFMKAQAWLSDFGKQQLEENADRGDTLLPERQIRGWFFSETVQQLLRPRLADLVFRHSTFDEYGWKERSGKNPQLMSGCPWHGGESGTAFQYGEEHGCWDCKACGVGGDVLDFIHKVETGDKHAGKPRGKDLENYVARIAGQLGLRYPEDANVQVTKEASGLRLGRRELIEEAKRLIKEVRNPAEQHLALMDLASRSGLYSLKATDLRGLAIRDSLYGETAKHGLVQQKGWTSKVDDEDVIIPGFLRRPTQVMLHARGGVGKTEMALALAKAVGRGESIKIRGLDVTCTKGGVLWFSNDQGNSHLAAMLEMQGIEENGRDKDWFNLVNGWKLDMLMELKELILEYRPVLCVMDSLGTIMEDIAKENEGDYARWIYQLTQLNGDETKPLGFPGTAFVWIHHNTKDNSTFRGSDRLLNAMEETWSLRELTAEEEAEIGVNRRILTVGKSRFGRGGDRLIVHRDLEFNFSISDMTPLIRKEGVNRTGDSTPESLVLALLAASGRPLTKEEVQEELHARMRGEGRSEKELPSEWGVRKYLKLWMAEGLVEEVKLPSSGRGRRKVGYLSRGKGVSLSHKNSPIDPEFFRRNGFGGANPPHRNSTPEGELTEIPADLTKIPDGGAEGPIRSPLGNRPISVSSAEKPTSHRNSAPENDCAASDLGEARISVSLEAPFSRGVSESTSSTQEITDAESTLCAASATGDPPQAAATGGSRAGGPERTPDSGDRPQVVDRIRLAHQGASQGVPERGRAGDEPLCDHGAPSAQGVELAQQSDQQGVRDALQAMEAPGTVGTEVPRGQDNPATGAGRPLVDAADHPAPSVHPAVPQPLSGSPQSQGVVGAGTEHDPSWDDFDTAFGF